MKKLIAKMKETFYPVITDEIQKTGEYELQFDKKNRNGYGGGLNRTGNGLRTIVDLGYYPHKNSPGTFHIEHCVYTMNKDGSFTLTKTLSNELDGKSVTY